MKKKVNKWDYYTEYDIDAEKLDDLGEQGWELVAVVKIETERFDFEFYFKRPQQ